MASPLNADVLAAMRDAAMATAQAQLKLAAACAAALGEDAPKLTKDGRKARGKREKDPNRPAYAETAYQLFMKETRATNTTLPKGKEAMRLIGEMWSKLPEAEKSAYQARAAKSREKYQAALAEYNANKKAAAKADSAAPAAEGPPKKKRRKQCGNQPVRQAGLEVLFTILAASTQRESAWRPHTRRLRLTPPNV